MKKRNPVEHFNDGRKAWENEAFGLVRFRGYAITVLTTVVLCGVPWWWPPNLGIFSISGDLALILLIASFGFLFLASMLYLRHRVIRSLNMKYHLHMISHEIRNHFIDIQSGNYNQSIEHLTHEVCNLVQRYFSILTNHKSNIGVAIRLAEKIDVKTVYKTFGRSCLNKNRGENSKVLGVNEGVAHILRNDKEKKGMLVYNDIPAAIAAGAYVEHPNDKDFPDDFCTMMVAPINGWDGEKKGCLELFTSHLARREFLGKSTQTQWDSYLMH